MKRLLLTYIIPLAASISVAIILYKSIIKTDFVKHEIKLEILLDAFQESEIQFLIEDNKKFKVENIQTKRLKEGKDVKVEFIIPETKKPGKFRIDPSYTVGKWNIKKITLIGLNKKVDFFNKELFGKFKPNNDIKNYILQPDSSLYIESVGNDPNIISQFSLKQYNEILNDQPTIYYIPFLLSFCISVLILYLVHIKLKTFVNIIITPSHLLALSFIIIISLPGIWMNLFPVSRISESENRILNTKPVFNFTNILSFPKAFNAYFEDNFGFKKEYSTINSYYKLKLFNTSSKPNTVSVGKDNWLFSIDPLNAGDYQNRSFFNLEQLKTIKHNLEEANKWYEKRGIHFFIMILPVKSSIYPEYLPNNIVKKNHISKLLQLRDYLEKTSTTKIIDLTNELLEAKKHKQVYYKHDIHWNCEGGYLGYKKLLNQMAAFNSNLQPVDLSSYSKKTQFKHNADLSKLLSLEDVLLNDEILFDKNGGFSFEEIDPPVYDITPIKQKTIRTQIKNSPLPKAIVYRQIFLFFFI